MQNSLISRIRDDEWFISLIERRLKENRDCANESQKEMNKIALRSSIDFRLKYIDGMISEEDSEKEEIKKTEKRKETIRRILEICENDGFVPQYGSSRLPSFGTGDVKLSPDGMFMAFSGNRYGVAVLPAKEWPLSWTVFTNGKKNAVAMYLSFSMDSSRIAILYREDKECSIHIWDVPEMKLLASLDADYNSPRNVISWSGNGDRISYADRERRTCVYDLKENRVIMSVEQRVSCACLDDMGEKILLINDSEISLRDITSETEVFCKKCSELGTMQEALFKDGEFFVLTGGKVFRINKDVEVKKLNEVMSPLDFKTNEHAIFNEFRLKADNGNAVLHSSRTKTLLSETLDEKEIRELDADQKDEHFFELLNNVVKKHLCFSQDKKEVTQTQYIVQDDSTVYGFEKVDDNGVLLKFDVKKYKFTNPPKKLSQCRTVPAELMERYEKISSGASDGKFLTDSELSINRSPMDESNRDMYFRFRGNEVEINDSSRFEPIDIEILKKCRHLFVKKITEDKRVYISDDEYLSEAIHRSEKRGHERKRVILSENGIEILPLRFDSRPIASDDPFNNYYLDKKHDLYSADPFLKSEKIADNDTLKHFSPEDIVWVSGHEWPKLFVIRNNVKVFIQSTPMEEPKIREDIHFSNNNDVHLLSGKIFWLSSDRDVCVSELHSSDIKRKNINSLTGWQSCGKTHDGRFSLIKFEESDDRKETIMRFARLIPESGKVDIFENARYKSKFDLLIREYLDADVKNTSVVIQKWGTTYSLAIKKDQLKEIKAATPDSNKLNVIITSVGNGKYLISTTEADEAEKGNSFSPQLRLMDSKTGSEIKYRSKRSEGQMYGLSGYKVHPELKAFTMADGRFFVSEVLGTIPHKWDYAVSSWDIKRGDRYPENKKIVCGRLLHKIDENSMFVSTGPLNEVLSVAVYNEKMKKLSKEDDERVAFKWCHGSDGPEYKGIDLNVLIEKFPMISELASKNVAEYISAVESISPQNSYMSFFKDGTVAVLPTSFKEKEDPQLPYIDAFKDYSIREKRKLRWMSVKAIIVANSFGRPINAVNAEFDIVVHDEPDGDLPPPDAFRSLSISHIDGTYVIQQPLRQSISDTPAEMRYRVRIINGKNVDSVIDNVLGWQPRSLEKKLVSVFTGEGSFSYVAVEGDDVLFITHEGKERINEKICNKGEYDPVALYHDKEVSISYDPFKKIMLFLKRGKMRRIGLGDLLDLGIFEFTAEKKDKTLCFKISESNSPERFIEITEDMRVLVSEKKKNDHREGNNICELDEGVIVKNGGVFVYEAESPQADSTEIIMGGRFRDE